MLLSKYLKTSTVLIVLSALISIVFFYLYGLNYYQWYGDSLGYYLYLPNIFINHNLSSIHDLSTYGTREEGVVEYIKKIPVTFQKSNNGVYINQYTMGVAIMEFPFFIIAHIYEIIISKDATGFSLSYNIAIRLSSIFYSFLGLFFCYKILKNYVSNSISIIVTVLLLIGTNLMWFSLIQQGMAHIPLFFLYSLLIYLTYELYTYKKINYLLLIGITTGLITLIRPTDIICFFIPLLFNVTSFKTLVERIKFLKFFLKQTLLSFFAFWVVLIPQLIYWKIYTGHFIFNSYGSQSFNWSSPMIIEGLIGANNGWLAYSPFMVFSIVGLCFWRRLQNIILPLLIIFILHIYISYSWCSYNYINGFGSRPMIDIYPLLIIPVGTFFNYVINVQRIFKILLIIIISFSVYVNLKFSYQQAEGELYSEASNHFYNIRTLFKPSISYNDLVVLDINQNQPDQYKLKFVKNLRIIDYADSLYPNKYYLLKDESLKSKISIVYDKKLFNNSKYIEVKLNCNSPYYVSGYYENTLIVLDIKRADSTLLWEVVKINNKIGINDSKEKNCLRGGLINQWGDVTFYQVVPENIKDGDIITVSIWNPHFNELKIKSLVVDLYK